MTNCYPSLLKSVEEIARNAGAAIYRIYGAQFSIVPKEDCSPLTEADCAAHSFIVDDLLPKLVRNQHRICG